MISLIVAIACAGVLFYILGQLPMPPAFRNVLYALSALFLVLYVLSYLGWWNGFGLPVKRWR